MRVIQIRLAEPQCPECQSTLEPRGLYYPKCGHALPKFLAVEREVVVEVKEEQFRKLSMVQREPIEADWRHVKRGRTVQGYHLGTEFIFLLEIKNESVASTVAEFDDLAHELTIANCGRITSDKYEVNLIRRLLNDERSSLNFLADDLECWKSIHR